MKMETMEIWPIGRTVLEVEITLLIYFLPS